jgi:hypothetical protein
MLLHSYVLYMSQSDAQVLALRPEYVRMPKNRERETYSRLSRPSLDRLVRPQRCNQFKPPVVSRIVRIHGGKNSRRGVRLILLSSLLAYLEQQPRKAQQILPAKAKRGRPSDRKQII